MTSHIELNNAKACVNAFTTGSGPTELHAIISTSDHMLSFVEQLEAVTAAHEQILKQWPGAQTVFKRYFLSDAANQADEIVLADSSDCAKSIIQQQPLNGAKVILWAYMLTDVLTYATRDGLFIAQHGAYRHLWCGSACNHASDSERQTRLLFNEYVMQLAEQGLTLEANCVRTWLFVNDIDTNYPGVVRARNHVFYTQGLTSDTHYIASTGIGGRGQDATVMCQMDTYAIDGLRPGQVSYLYAPTHLNRTSDYGVSFERGTRIDYGDRRHVLISGTASIDNKGMIVHEKDVKQQTLRMLENVEALLREAGCGFDDVGYMIVYLRDAADYYAVKQLLDSRLPQKPCAMVHAAVCRPGWLVEMECMAVKAQHEEGIPCF